MTCIPLSHSDLRAPWPIATFNVMSKPGRAGAIWGGFRCVLMLWRGRMDAGEGRMKRLEQEEAKGAEDGKVRNDSRTIC